MNTYIKFEDTYGIADIFTKIRYNSFIDDMYGEYKDCAILRGLSTPKVLELKGRDISIIDRNNITRIIVVFDMDSTYGIKDKIIDINKIIEYHNKSIQKLKENNIKAAIEYVPITYAAESISICQYIDKFEAEYVIDAYDTTKLHKDILKKILLKRNISANNVKKTRNFLDKNRQINGLKSLNGLNKVCYNFINNLDALSIEKCIQYINTLYNIFYKHCSLKDIEENYNKVDMELGSTNSYKNFCVRCNNKYISESNKDRI